MLKTMLKAYLQSMCEKVLMHPDDFVGALMCAGPALCWYWRFRSRDTHARCAPAGEQHA
jgi:hypothetical protein